MFELSYNETNRVKQVNDEPESDREEEEVTTGAPIKHIEEAKYSPLKEEQSCNEEDDEKLDRKTVDNIFANFTAKPKITTNRCFLTKTSKRLSIFDISFDISFYWTKPICSMRLRPILNGLLRPKRAYENTPDEFV